MSKERFLTKLRFASFGGIVPGPGRTIALQALPALWTHTAKLDTRSDALRVAASTSPVVRPRGNSPSAVAAGKEHGELPGLCKVERS
jgi:hypothetical protein